MSVSSVVFVHYRPWRGYQDPGLPTGMWVSQGTILGDAGGGTKTVIMRFKEEGLPLGGRFYNIEQLEIHDTDVGARNAVLRMVNFDILSATGLVNREVHLEMDSDGTTNVALSQSGPRLPIFVGRPTLVGVTSQLEFGTPNSDGETFFATAQGYIWEPRSLLEDGGLRRPLDSLYG